MMVKVSTVQQRLRSAIVVAGALAVTAALVLILTARIMINRSAYVSELGAIGEGTAPLFNTALMMLGLGAIVTGVAGWHPRSTISLLGRWSVGVTLMITGSSFAVASLVPCTQFCPIPGATEHTGQDSVHLAFAILGFAAACLAMIQTATSSGKRVLRVASLLFATVVAVIASIGGLIALHGEFTSLGAILEFVATGIAVFWFIPYALNVMRPTSV